MAHQVRHGVGSSMGWLVSGNLLQIAMENHTVSCGTLW
jgi:hypothetical protein